MSDTPNPSDDFDFDEMGKGEDPFAENAESSGGGGDPFDFSAEEGGKAPTAPAKPSPAKASSPKGASAKAGTVKKAKAAKAAPKATATKSAPVAHAPTGVQAAAGLAADTPVQVVAVMGKKNITVNDLISMKKGEVLELNRFPNEAVDLVANGKLMAKGELVEIDGKLGVRIIKIFE